ncbi:MAG: ABC transporter ATP-binding protein [Desulfobacteraceae bacterium]
MIRVGGLSKTYDPRDGAVLEDIGFSVAQGQTVAVIGPSGCGKTTLLYILAGLMKPTSGEVNVGRGKDCEVSFILQDFGLFPWKNVYDNVTLGLRIRRTSKERMRALAEPLLKELGLSGLKQRYPVQLSGGQKQRVAIARALAVEPEVLLMDEPFSSLDAITRENLQNTLLETWTRRRLTYVVVTHSVEEAVFLGARVLILTDRPARVKALVENPGFGEPGLRTRPEFFECVSKVRRELAA